jgi:hypothetical protein
MGVHDGGPQPHYLYAGGAASLISLLGVPIRDQRNAKENTLRVGAAHRRSAAPIGSDLVR